MAQLCVGPTPRKLPQFLSGSRPQDFPPYESNPQRVGPGPANQDGYDDREQGECEMLSPKKKRRRPEDQVDQRYRPQEDPQEVVYPQEISKAPKMKMNRSTLGKTGRAYFAIAVLVSSGARASPSGQADMATPSVILRAGIEKGFSWTSRRPIVENILRFSEKEPVDRVSDSPLGD